MRYFLFSLLACLSTAGAFADNSNLYWRLDSVVNASATFTMEKERHIYQMKKHIPLTKSATTRLKLYDDIFNEYHYFRFDSAMVYVDKGIRLAKESHDSYYTQLNIIHKATLLSSAGLYSEALALLDKLDDTPISQGLVYDYNLALYWLYTYWSDYADNSEYRSVYWDKKLEYLRKTIAVAKDRPNDYYYLLGEYEMYVNNNHTNALHYYNKVLSLEPENTRLYSTACFAAACCYEHLKQYEKYESYMVRTAITDIMTPVKENLSLYKVAVWLFSTNGDIRRAETYMSLSIDDAKFYSNRLRIISSTDKLPMIVSRFKAKINGQNKRLRLALLGGLFLLLALVVAAAFIVRQNGLLAKRRKEIAEQNKLLKGLNEELSELNGKLTTRNENLVDVNQRREKLAKLYIDLCSKYIDRLNSYQTFVYRKVKVNQINDLKNAVTSSRLSDEDAVSFLHGFDKAFLDLYPSFVAEFNKLLAPGNLVSLKSGNMPTELRLFALIRLGVKESSEIANLLFCTPRTIYNYRSAIKAKAINKETFEDDVRSLCM
ncbi:MAG TPA: hypothetical protein DEQ17_01885 [Prevotella sp.]|nr:hypothetical protein [Prevotella sp.]